MSVFARHGRSWPLRVFRVVAFMHFAFVAFGIYNIASAAVGLSAGGYFTRPIDPSAPFERQVYLVRTTVNLCFLAALVAAGVSLLRRHSEGVRTNNVVLGSLIAYFVLSVSLAGTGPLGMSVAATAGIGEMGIGLMMITGYPIIALLLLNFGRRRLRATQPVTETVSGVT